MNHPEISLRHLVRQPIQPSHGPPPLLILAHGYGSNEQDLIGLADYLDDRLLIVSVRATLSMGGGAYAWFSIVYTPSGIEYDQEEAEAGAKALEKAVDEILAAYEVNRRCVFLGGFSQGAIMSLSVALGQPEKFAGVLVMSGRVPPSSVEKADPQRVRDLSIFAAHGKWDEVIPVDYARHMREALEELPVDLTYREYPMGHQVSAESLADIDAWMRSKLS